MTTVTVSGSAAQVVFNATDALFFGSYLGTLISAAEAAGTVSNFSYSSANGSTAPAPATGAGVVLFATAPVGPVTVPAADSTVVDYATTAVSIVGGAAGGTVLAGSGGLTYTGITPGGTALNEVAAGDGPNLIQTSTSGGGSYYFATGAGNDTIGALTGNATIDAGTGRNLIVLGGGANVIYSEGYDSIVGNIVPGGGGTDTVNIQAGQATINPGSSNFVINDGSSNPLTLLVGTGSDTVNVTGTGLATLASGIGNASLVLQGTGTATAAASMGNILIDASGAAGSATFQYQFTSGISVGADTVRGFAGADTLQLLGYGLTPTSAAASAVTSGGSTTLTLSGGTTITLTGVTSLSSTQIKTS